MSHRIHVIAVHGASAAEFQQALNALRPQDEARPAGSPFRFGASGDWQWAWASVWHVTGDEIDRATAALPGVAIRTTTADGVLWTLTVASGAHELFRGVHFFTAVGWTDWDVPTPEEDDVNDPLFPEDAADEVAGIDRDDPELQFLWDEAEAEEVETRIKAEVEMETPWREYLDYGVVFPEATLRQMEGLPTAAAERVAFYAHAEQIADALAARGVPFDRDAVVRLLTVGPLTKWERESDLGNLLRFLSLLGIVGLSDEALAEASKDEEEAAAPMVDWSRFHGRERLQAVRSLMQGREPAPLAGAPVDLKFADVVHLITLADFCDADEGPMSVSLRFADDEYELNEAWSKLGDRGIELERIARQCTLAFDPAHRFHRFEDRKEFARHGLIQALATLSDGVEVEVAHSVAGTRDGCHRYRGVIHGGGFRLLAAHPPLDKLVLRDALALMELTLGKEPIPVDGPDEEQRMREAYHYVTGEKARVRQGKIKADAGRHAVVRCKFVTQFTGRGAWDIEGAERRRREVAAELDALLQQPVVPNDPASAGDEPLDPAAEAEAAKWAARFQEMAERARQAKLVPRSNDFIFEGKVSRYYHAPITALEHVTAEEISDLDRQLAELGFRWVCDSASERFGESITRSYAGVKSAIALYDRRTASNSHAINSDGVLLDFSQGILEFQTHFHDGSTLVTGSIEAATSMPKKRIFIRSYEGRSVADLWAKHIDGVGRLAQKRQTQPLDHTQFHSPAAFAKIVDSLMSRYLGE